ncbi:MAG TPA: hypothetical protein VGP92_05690 [Acidimicrobiia bacterium]|nr:hypothetical protein [Acidimicrobiia bacterium]
MRVRRAAEEALVASMDDRDGALDVTRAVSAEGDDIVVVPGDPAEPPRTRRRAALALGGIVAALLVVGGIALAARNSDAKPTVSAAPPTTILTRSIAKVHPKVKVKVKAPKATVPKVVTPTVVVTTVANTAPHITVGTSGAITPHVTNPAPPPTAAPAKNYSASVLTWQAPRSLTMAAGTTKTFSVTAHNPTDGTVTLPHPLGCAPRLDGQGVCTEMAQLVGPGATASANLTLDATGIAAGHYSISIEGVLTIAVTVT